jgi:hypothetical protein
MSFSSTPRISKRSRSEDDEEIVSFRKFYKYIDSERYCLDEIQICQMKVSNLLDYKEFENLDYSSKKCIIIASVMIIMILDYNIGFNEVIEYFDINDKEQNIIISMIENENKDWKAIPKDMYYCSKANIEKIFKYAKKFNYNIDIKDEIYNFIKNNLNKINNKTIQNMYKSIINSYNFINADKLYLETIQNFFN